MTMSDDPNPVIYIGQGACALARSIHDLNKKLQYPDIPSLLLDEEAVVVKPNSLSRKGKSPEKLRHEPMTKFHLPRCGHGILEAERECLVCRDKTSQVFIVLKQFCENRDYASCIYIVAEIHTAFACWIYDRVMEYLQLDGFAAAINTVLVKPALRISGIDNVYATYISAMALEHSKQVLLRGIDEYLSIPDLASNEKNNLSYDAVDLHHIIACDLWPALACHDGTFYENGQYYLWPNHLAHSSSKLFDVRTSLFKTLQKVDRHKKKGGTSNLDINPNRILASNVHHLHLSYLSVHPNLISNQLKKENQLFLGSHVKMRMDQEGGKNSFLRSLDQGGSDFTSLMGWATNGVKWELIEECSAYNLYSRAPTSQKSTRTTQQAKTEKANEEERISGMKIPFTAVVFDSIYAREDLQVIIDRTMDLLATNAYSHRFNEDTYLCKDSIFDCVTLIHSHLDELSVFHR